MGGLLAFDVLCTSIDSNNNSKRKWNIYKDYSGIPLGGGAFLQMRARGAIGQPITISGMQVRNG